MVDPPKEPTEPTPPETSTTGFGAIAQKLKRRTTDLLALAILAIGILAVGTKVSRWWKQSPEDVTPAPLAVPRSLQIGEDGNGVTLEFGELNQALFRQVITGDAASAGEQLEQIALAQLSKVSLAESSPSLAEQRLLEELASVRVSRTLPAGEALYRIGEDLPMVIVTRSIANSKNGKPSESRRVVTWARAFPRGANEWLVVLFYPTNGKAASRGNEVAIPLPQGATRIQSIRDALGQSWIAFRGAGPIAEWQRHFDREFRDRDWDRVQPWRETSSGWTVAFASSKTRQTAVIWLGRNADGDCEGMLLIEAVPSNAPSSE
jgi:hypothetical protein